eukprot:gene8298-11229_t
MNSNSLLSLPEMMIQTLALEWLNLKDISQLDSSLCNKSERELFWSALDQFQMVFKNLGVNQQDHDFLNFDHEFTDNPKPYSCSIHFLKWLHRRNLKISQLRIRSELFSSKLNGLDKWFSFVAPHVTNLDILITSVKPQTKQASKRFAYFTNVKTLHLHYFDDAKNPNSRTDWFVENILDRMIFAEVEYVSFSGREHTSITAYNALSFTRSLQLKSFTLPCLGRSPASGLFSSDWLYKNLGYMSNLMELNLRHFKLSLITLGGFFEFKNTEVYFSDLIDQISQSMKNLKLLDLVGNPITDELIQILSSSLLQLETLNIGTLYKCEMTEVGINSIRNNLKSLKKLEIEFRTLSPAKFVSICSLIQLETLKIGFIGIEHADEFITIMPDVERLKNLTSFKMEGFDYLNKECGSLLLNHLPTCLTSLILKTSQIPTQLTLSDFMKLPCSYFTIENFAIIATKLTNLTSLSILRFRNKFSSIEPFQLLSKLNNLTRLELQELSIPSANVLSYFGDNFPQLIELRLYYESISPQDQENLIKYLEERTDTIDLTIIKKDFFGVFLLV